MLDHVLTFFSFDKNISSLIGLRQACLLQGRAYFNRGIIRREQKECLTFFGYEFKQSFRSQGALKWAPRLARLKQNFQDFRGKYQYASDFENVLLLQSRNNIKGCYFFAIKNGYIYTFHRLRKLFFFLISDQEIIEKAFEVALFNNQPTIFSFFIKNDSSFFKKKEFIRKVAKQVTQFCTLSTFEMFIRYYESLGIPIKQRLLYFAAKNNRLDIVEYLLSAKGASLNIFLKVDTAEFVDGPIRKLLSDRRCLNELKGDLRIIHEMEAEVLNDKNIFHPSRFWSFFNEVNLVHLKEYGFRNFKKNVNQNYFNFIPNLKDVFFLSILLLKLFGRIKLSGTYTLVDPDIINNKGGLKERYRRIFQKNRFLSLWLYKYTVSNLWEYVKGQDVQGLLETLEEPHLGNPIEIRKDQKLISQDLASSVQEYYFMRPYFKEHHLRIVEIGAGYGRLGYVLLNALKCKYIVFDISPALYISQKYITTLFPDKKIFHFRSINSFEEIQEELEQSDIAFFTINQIKFFPENFCDFSINISSLHEMTTEQRDKMCEYMSKITKEFIYIKQYKKYKNPFDKIVTKEKKLPIFCCLATCSTKNDSY